MRATNPKNLEWYIREITRELEGDSYSESISMFFTS